MSYPTGALARTKLYLQKWRWYERNRLPWRRARIHLHMLRAGAFIRFPVQGNVLEALDDGRLRIGEGTLLEPGCWITIADHVMFTNRCFVADASHRYDDPDMPVTWQGFTSKGPTTIGSNCWFGAGCVVNTGVTVGERCVIGANSVVTEDIPPGVIAVGAPARVIREIEFRPSGAD